MADRYAPMEERFWAKVDRTDSCWNWLGWRTTYGRFRDQNRQLLAHRVAYELTVGPIPEGLQLDHLCRNTRCVNPAHLEPVTGEENLRRQAAAVTACPEDHAYTEENTYRDKRGRRSCRACKAMRNREWLASRVTCWCGAEVRRNGLARHNRQVHATSRSAA